MVAALVSRVLPPHKTTFLATNELQLWRQRAPIPNTFGVFPDDFARIWFSKMKFRMMGRRGRGLPSPARGPAPPQERGPPHGNPADRDAALLLPEW